MISAVRSYKDLDYQQLKSLYSNSKLYGGQFDDNRDSKGRLKKRIEADPDSILVYEKDGQIVGTVSLIEDGRVAWLFRFAVSEIAEKEEISRDLFSKAVEIIKQKGHNQVLIYTPVGNEKLYDRYNMLGFSKGSDYTCFWKDI